MPCTEKIHIVEEKWRRIHKREEEAERERVRREAEAIPAPEWPVKKPVPAEAANE